MRHKQINMRVDVLDHKSSSEDRTVDAEDQDSSKSCPLIEEEETSSVQTKNWMKVVARQAQEARQEQTARQNARR